MARNDPTIYMRIPQGLKDSLDKSAEQNKRSMTAEVVARLQASFDGPKIGFGPGSVGEQLKQAKAELDVASDLIVERVVQRLIERGASVLPSTTETGSST